MPSDDRSTRRRAFVDAWRKARTGEPLEPVEAQIVDVAHPHPEYHAFLEDPEDTLDRDFLPEYGEPNPSCTWACTSRSSSN